jgi:flagellar assembly factor FliW
MLIDTTRFGQVEIDEGRMITFHEGLLGFPAHRRFALIQTAVDPVFLWLQSAEDPAVAFVVCDPLAFAPDYRAPIRMEDVEALGMHDLADAQVLVIVNKVDDHLTANLLGPLVVGVQSRLGKQLVLADKRYSTRTKLLRRSAAEPVCRTA